MKAPNCPCCESPGVFVTGKGAEPMPEGHAHWRCTGCGINSAFDLSVLKETTVPKPPFTNCYACKHSGMEPDNPRLICGHPDSGTYGKYVTKGLRGEATPLPHCKGEKFEQHPDRNRDGTLKR